MSQINEIVEFLLARIAEDEAVAREVVGTDGPDTIRGRLAAAVASPDLVIAGGIAASDENVTVYINPMRVLADVAAKRRIVNAWRSGFPAEDRYATGWHDFHVHALCLLALPYADHPDYREEEWRP
jgi:hypothetical protein